MIVAQMIGTPAAVLRSVMNARRASFGGLPKFNDKEKSPKQQKL